MLPPAQPDFAPELQLDDALRPLLAARGIDALYRHQARAIAALRAGADVVLATPPSTQGLGAALADRLTKAAGPRS